MSTFNGKIKEIPNISVDNFYNISNTSSYFLSHCHWDHMQGLLSPELELKMETSPVPIYCSDVSAKILASLNPKLTEYIVPLKSNISGNIIKNLNITKKLHSETNMRNNYGTTTIAGFNPNKDRTISNNKNSGNTEVINIMDSLKNGRKLALDGVESDFQNTDNICNVNSIQETSLRNDSNSSILSTDVKGGILNVLLIPAGHCPGSVMFLFELQNGKRILYTGDFRISVGDVKKFKQFHDASGNSKKIHNIYLDTTFYMDCYNSFPLRETAADDICNFISNWLEKNDLNSVFLDLRANFGYECLLKTISDRFKMPIHVKVEKDSLYGHFPNMDGVITTNADQTRIHACCNKTEMSPNRNNLSDSTNCQKILANQSETVLFILPSAMFWTSDKLADKDELSVTDNKIRVCYSTHASLEEIDSFLQYLHPENVTACVVSDYNRDYLHNLLNFSSTKDLVREKSQILDYEFDFRNVKKRKIVSGSRSSLHEKYAVIFD